MANHTTHPPPPNPSPPPPPAHTHTHTQVREVLDTMRTAARLGSSSLAAYVISMSQAASDVLAVELLQKEARLMVSKHWGSLRTINVPEGWVAGTSAQGYLCLPSRHTCQPCIHACVHCVGVPSSAGLLPKVAV
jgi:hypothetical protein